MQSLIHLLHLLTTSRLTLPVVSVYAIIMALSLEGTTPAFFFYLAAMMLAAYLMVVMNNAYSLIRVYTRTVSATFLVLMLMCPFLSREVPELLSTILFIGFYLLLFRSYQDRHASGTLMYAFLCLGLIGTIFPQMLFFLPVALLLMFTRMLSGNRKTLVAALLGYFVPYWIWAGWCAFNANFLPLEQHFAELATFTPALYPAENVEYVLSLVFIFVVTAVGIVHCLHESYADRIKTRMLFDTIIWTDVFFIIFLLLQPQHYDVALRFVIISSSPIISHYFTLSRTRVTAIVFLVVLVLALAFTTVNTWIL